LDGLAVGCLTVQVDPRFRTIHCVKVFDVSVQQLAFKADMGLIVELVQCCSTLSPPSLPSAEAAEQVCAQRVDVRLRVRACKRVF
jgi:hypothetical protein